MPNFDGTGPLKRGRIIGRGRGSCGKHTLGHSRANHPAGEPIMEEKSTG
jgi:hypothetical protein